MPRTNLLWLFAVPALFALGVAMTLTAPPPDKDYLLVRRIVDVLAEVDKNYVRELSDADKKKLVEDMIIGGLERLDPHSTYFNEDQLKEFDRETEGHFGGIGVILGVDPKAGMLRVETPIPGGPAFEAGLQSGDIITKIEGKSTEGMSLPAAKKYIVGKPDTEVTFTIFFLEEQKEREVKLKRKLIEDRTIRGHARRVDNPSQWEWMADPASKIALIRLYNGFNERTTPELVAALKEIDEAGAKALILDVRDNPGGLLNQAIAVSDLFLPEADVVSTRDRRERSTARKAKTQGTAWESHKERPMAVIVNRGSASASEIVAAALQDHKRAVVVGERSFGKGSVQRVYSFQESQTAVKLTVEEWLRPNGQSIHRFPDSKPTDPWGVKPDDGLEVSLNIEEYREYIRSVNESMIVKRKNDNAKEKDAKPAQDKMLNVAIDYLKKQLKP